MNYLPKKATRSAQYPLIQEFQINYNDFVADSVTGSLVTFGSSVALADPGGLNPTLGAANTGVTFDAIALPPGAVVESGELIVQTPFAGATGATIAVGVAGATTEFLAATSLTAAAETTTAFTVLPLAVNAAGGMIRLTVATLTAGGATAGLVRVRVRYTIDGRVSEVSTL